MKIIINGEIVEVAEGGSGDTTFLVKAPIGTIVIWSGTADNIPSGWQLCDGTNGTPDLRDKFVLGAGSTYEVGATGGEATHTLRVREIPSHSHSINNTQSESYLTQNTGSNPVFPYAVGSSVATGASGGGQPHNNLPPYYALCYIMKLTADPAVDGVTMDQVNTAIQTAVADIQPQEVYSTEETRIGTWIDGKPLYRKVYSNVTVPSGATSYHEVSVDTPELNIDFLLRSDLHVHRVNTNSFDDIQYISTFNGGTSGYPYFSIRYNVTDGKIYVLNNSSIAGTKTFTIIIEYTKTTDEATS